MTRITATTLRRTAIAGFATIMMIAAGSVAAPGEAHAGNGGIAAAVITGAVFGSFLAANAQPAYVGPAYGTIYTPTCWMERQFAGYDYYSRPVYTNVQVCR